MNYMPVARTAVFVFATLLSSDLLAKDASLEKVNSVAATKYRQSTSSFVLDGTAFLKMNDAEHISYAGLRNYDDQSNRQGSMMYSGAAGAAGILAQILAHAAIESGMESSAEKKAQDQANRVLDHFRPVIESFMPGDLRALSEKYLDDSAKAFIRFEATPLSSSENTDESSPQWILESHPLFLMAEDKRSLLLQNVIVLSPVVDASKKINKKKPGGMTPPVYRNIVEVTSNLADGEDANLYWMTDGKILEVSSVLFSMSLNLAVSDMHHELIDAEEKDRTFRYPMAGGTMFERGRMLSGGNGRTVIRTLRGWIKSLPNNQEGVGK